MDRRSVRDSIDDDSDPTVDPVATDDVADLPSEPTPSGPPSLAGLTVGGLTKRRLVWIGGALLSAWIVVVFARQVGDASALAAEANQARLQNAVVAANLASLQSELALVQRPDYILQQARGLGLGTAREHAFELAPGAPSLPPDAPGSAAVRLGAPASSPSPLDTWLEMLFGPSPGN